VTQLKLIKFRPVATCEHMERVLDILKTGEFWCSRFWELNDPMEGVFLSDSSTFSSVAVDAFFGKKASLVLCSFSSGAAISSPLMWGYYANGLRGVAIEITIDANCPELYKIEYAQSIPSVTHGDGEDAVRKVLASKLKPWKHEYEQRWLFQGEPGACPIGRVEKVYIGQPHSHACNRRALEVQDVHRRYQERVSHIREVAARRNVITVNVGLSDHRGRTVVREIVNEMEC
jgi:hypothetical protein